MAKTNKESEKQKFCTLSPRPNLNDSPPNLKPNHWFGHYFPTAVEEFGPGFLLQHHAYDQRDMTSIAGINIDAWARALGSEKQLGVEVIFYEPEQTFLFYDWRRNSYEPTTEGKMKLILSNYLVRCADQCPRDIIIENMFIKYRTDEWLEKIVSHAKVVLSKGPSFFDDPSKNVRSSIKSLAPVGPFQFAKEALRSDRTGTLTLKSAHQAYREYCYKSGCIPVDLPQFRLIFTEAIEKLFNLKLRHDIMDESKKQQRGFKGIILTLPDNT